MKAFLAFKLSGVIFINLFNIKRTTLVVILTFVSIINLMFRLVEQEKSCITSGPGFQWSLT